MQRHVSQFDRRTLLSIAMATTTASIWGWSACTAEEELALDPRQGSRKRLPQDRLNEILGDTFPIGRTASGSDVMLTRCSSELLRGSAPPSGIQSKLRRIAIVLTSPVPAKTEQIFREDIALVMDLLVKRIESTDHKTDLTIEFVALPAATGNTPAGESRFPPTKGFYDHPTDPQARYLWNWLAVEGFDLVIELAITKDRHLGASADAAAMLKLSQASLNVELPLGSISRAISAEKVAGVGSIPALYIAGPASALPEGAKGILLELTQLIGKLPNSPAHEELIQRVDRDWNKLNTILSETYNKKPNSLSYISSLILLGRLNFAALSGDVKAVTKLMDDIRDLAQTAIAKPPKSSPEVAGLLLFGILQLTFDFKQFALEKDRKLYLQALHAGADQAFDPSGKPLPIAPHHGDMSDAIFMWSPLLVLMHTITEEARYLDAALIHTRAMQKKCLREDGLYRHSPLCEGAWGRGNGFAAVGLTLAADFAPPGSEAKTFFQEAAIAIVDQLTERSLASATPGMLTQLIDEPSSYREFTSSAMVAWSAGVLVSSKLVDDDRKTQFRSYITAALDQLSRRMADDGSFVDVCVGTGKQPNLDAYFHRPASQGRDDRGAAMMLMLQLQRQMLLKSENQAIPEAK
ncbi:glycosyl hydrolase family 88 [Pirellula staleyi DSM 6068]|uniref:Glycosyl hydrolase family 88 n=1 Tax=Pirellula staleyi (strain ATCC 27377 / DSM 6068 / ICPB 4128) TaxID=530564 RepID=D2R8S8_PIRSD|nr:glycosyl hydrolase family 88 [Pirellula staleyi DSM 6068]